jgi:hypothetical protein
MKFTLLPGLGGGLGGGKEKGTNRDILTGSTLHRKGAAKGTLLPQRDRMVQQSLKKGGRMKMRKLACALAAVAIVATTAGISFAGPGPATGVNESWHDITYLGMDGRSNYEKDQFERVCVFCHTPHNALPNGLVPAPLWNHAPSTVMLEPYTWAAPANSLITVDDPLIGPSRLCMACHDGLTAVDSHGSAGSESNGNNKMAAYYMDGLNNVAKRYIEDLAVTHPIGFRYQDAVTQRNTGGLTEIITADQKFLASVPANPDTHLRANWPKGSKTIGDTLYGGFFTCASCHEVHNTNNARPLNADNTYNYFLWAPEEGSAICLSCHVK